MTAPRVVYHPRSQTLQVILRDGPLGRMYGLDVHGAHLARDPDRRILAIDLRVHSIAHGALLDGTLPEVEIIGPAGPGSPVPWLDIHEALDLYIADMATEEDDESTERFQKLLDAIEDLRWKENHGRTPGEILMERFA